MPEPLLQFTRSGTYATAEVSPSKGGFCSTWCISESIDDSLQLISFWEIPVYGENADQAAQRAKFIAPDVMTSALKVYGGTGTVVTKPAENHGVAHLAYHYGQMIESPKLERTILLYELLSQFRMSKPVQKLAQVEGLSNSRTIQYRLLEAREKGLLDAPGRGKSYS